MIHDEDVFSSEKKRKNENHTKQKSLCWDALAESNLAEVGQTH